MPSSWLSLPSHILPGSSHSLFCFLPSFCSVSFLSDVIGPFSFASFSCFAHLFYIFCLCLHSDCLCFLTFCVLTTSSHLPSSDLSGPETPSSSAHHPLPPPTVLTPHHTAPCAVVSPWASRGASLPKDVCPPGGALVANCLCVFLESEGEW